MRRGFGLVLALLTAVPAAAQDRAALYGACFVGTYNPAAGAQGSRRVAAMAVQFQGFENSLLAAVQYRLRFGTKFGFSGECAVDIEGGFQCEACGNDRCGGGGESFKILWPGGDRITLANDATGLLAENAAGGRDRLPPGGANGSFELKRGAPGDCAW
ncbi:MAG: hypothetical protein H0T75_00550 [Rhizobiales bacterium]|nr:hypothetical protein [Hyphomicrobiales bacterium]